MCIREIGRDCRLEYELWLLHARPMCAVVQKSTASKDPTSAEGGENSSGVDVPIVLFSIPSITLKCLSQQPEAKVLTGSLPMVSIAPLFGARVSLHPSASRSYKQMVSTSCSCRHNSMTGHTLESV
eukprot:6188850-Pleurochrysis_carterae.AAC.1